MHAKKSLKESPEDQKSSQNGLEMCLRVFTSDYLAPPFIVSAWIQSRHAVRLRLLAMNVNLSNLG